MAALDASVLTAVMIESRNALDAVEAIASVDGLDLLFIGAHDPAADLGLAGHGDHPALRLALARIRQACLDAGKALGLAVWPASPRCCANWPPRRWLPGLDGHGPACLLGAATQRAAAAHAARPAGANPSSSRTAARR